MVIDIIKYLSHGVRIFFTAGPLGAPCVTSVPHTSKAARLCGFHKPRQHFVYLSVHVSRPCWIEGSPLIAMMGLSHVKDTFCLSVASLLVKPSLTE